MPAERIEHGGVKARADHDQFRPEGVKRRNDQALEGREIGARAAARRQRRVDIETLAAPLAPLGACAAAVARKQAVLVQRDHQRVRVLVEGLLRAVAVVDVPIHDRDAVDQRPVRDAFMIATGHVAEEATVPDPLSRSAWLAKAGAREQEPLATRAGRADCFDEGGRSSSGEQRDVVAARTKWGEIARVAAAIGA